jgi:ABC-2 type transport system ATP-binding protein
MLESRAVHPGRSARGHLLALAYASGIPRRRVDMVLGLTGLEAVAGRRAGGFSLGKTQLVLAGLLAATGIAVRLPARAPHRNGPG